LENRITTQVLGSQALDLQLQVFPVLPQKIQQAAHASLQSLVGVLQNLWHLPTQAGWPFREADAALQKLSNLMTDNTIDDRLDSDLPLMKGDRTPLSEVHD